MGGWPGGWVALEEWKVRLTSAKVEVEADLEKVVNRPQVEKPELYDVLKIAGFATMDEQKYMY